MKIICPFLSVIVSMGFLELIERSFKVAANNRDIGIYFRNAALDCGVLSWKVAGKILSSDSNTLSDHIVSCILLQDETEILPKKEALY